MMDIFFDPKSWCAIVSILLMEAVVGVDNLVYLALLTDGQPEQRRQQAEQIGLILAIVLRLVQVVIVVGMLELIQPMVTIFDLPLSWRDIVLVGGGLILLVKGTQEIYGILEIPSELIEGTKSAQAEDGVDSGINWLLIGQIVLIDTAFAADSVASAFALTTSGWTVAFGLVLGMGVLFLWAGPLSVLFNNHRSIRITAFGAMLMLGLVLLCDGLGTAIPKSYLYFVLGLVVVVLSSEIIFHRKA